MTSDSIKTVRDFLAIKPSGKSIALINGNICMYKYNPINPNQIYDKTPLIVVLKATSRHVLGLNLHWCPKGMRKKFVNLILNINKKNIYYGRDAVISYTLIKPILKKLGFAPVIRKYIRSRISRGVIIIPAEKMPDIIKLDTATITGHSPEKLYSLAKKKKI